MGVEPTSLPEQFLRRMNSTDRKALGKLGRLQSECDESYEAKREKHLQQGMEALLRQRNCFFFRPRMDKKLTGLPKGWPDFTIILPGGRALLCEAKVAEGRFSAEQMAMARLYHEQTGEIVRVVYSLAQFRDLLDEMTYGRPAVREPAACDAAKALPERAEKD